MITAFDEMHADDGSVRDNIAYGRNDASDAEVEDAIAVHYCTEKGIEETLGELERSSLFDRPEVAAEKLAALAVTPADVARIQALVDEGALNDKLARQVFDGVLAGEGWDNGALSIRNRYVTFGSKL